MEDNVITRKKRVTVAFWIGILWYVAQAIFCAIYMFRVPETERILMFGVTSILCIVCILGIILLMRWIKTGFFLLVGVSVINALMSYFLLGLPPIDSIGNLGMPVIVWGILQTDASDYETIWSHLWSGWDYLHCRHLYQVFAGTGLLLFVTMLIAVGIRPKINYEDLIAQYKQELVEGLEIVELKDYTIKKVSDLPWESPLGQAKYFGEVILDTISGVETMIPHGEGKAFIIGGEYIGSKYEGAFVSGVMEGPAVYTTSDGDVFKGTFKANEYYVGTYTIKKNGEYFMGTFKDGQPDKGDWFDKYGHKIP